MSLFLAVDLNWFVQFIVTVLIVAVGLLHLVKNTASNYFLAEDSDHDRDTDEVSDWSSSSSTASAVCASPAVTTTTTTGSSVISSDSEGMATARAAAVAEGDSCAVCGCRTKKKCSGCKIVMYCSEACQKSHWRSEHKKECMDFRIYGTSIIRRGSSTISVNSPNGASKSSNQLKKSCPQILFPYEDFVDLFNWDKPGFPPCGLLNCGNSCFANVVLQCLTYTRPLIAFLLEKGHRRECRRNDWCFLCEFQTHVERANQSLNPFSPINILSRLPNIGGNLGYGKQEDAHEFMRFAIDTMQSVCLDEFGGEKAVHPSSQETTLVQHIFGGHLQSQVICTKCNNVSNQFENMMDLTVEIQGDAASIEDCLDQFTAKEWLHGDNMYKCDGCNAYVMAWKRLTVRRAPNILTIALKRFQSGRFGKLNKRVNFPEILDLSPYMSETAEDDNIYKLYAVIVHLDMLNASFFGHYICYIKDFHGKWYRVDDCKVTHVDLDEVLSEGAYMLLYSRSCARKSCLYPVEPPRKEELTNVEVEEDVELSSTLHVQSPPFPESADVLAGPVKYRADTSLQTVVGICNTELASTSNSEGTKEDVEMVDFVENYPISLDNELCEFPFSVAMEEAAVPLVHTDDLAPFNISAATSYLTEADTVKRTPSSPSSNVKSDSGSSNRISQDFSLTCSSDQDLIVTPNHEDLTEEMPLDVSTAVPSSSEISQETKLADSRDKSGACGTSSSGVIYSNLCPDASREFFSKHFAANDKPLIHPGFLDKDSLAMQNHIDTGAKLPLDVSAAVLSSKEILENAADSRNKAGLQVPFSDGITASIVCQDVRESDVKPSVAKEKPLFRSGFLKENLVGTENDTDGREEIFLDVSAAPASSSAFFEEVKAADSLDNTGKAACERKNIQVSNGFQDAARISDGKFSVPKVKPLFAPGFLQVNSLVSENHVDVKEEMHDDLSAAVSSSSKVLEETKTAYSMDMTRKAACGMPRTNGFQDAARKSDGKKSAAKVKPLLRRGFLEKHRQNKHIKIESDVSAEAGEVISSDNVHCQNNGVDKLNKIVCEFDGTITNGDNGGQFGCCNGSSAENLGKTGGMIKKDTQKEIVTTGFDESPSILNGGSGK